jgi:hypothetical protein
LRGWQTTPVQSTATVQMAETADSIRLSRACISCGTSFLMVLSPPDERIEFAVEGSMCDGCDVPEPSTLASPATRTVEAVFVTPPGGTHVDCVLRETGRTGERPGDTTQREAAQRLADRLGEATWAAIDRAWRVEHCATLVALADRLDDVHRAVRRGTARQVRLVVRLYGAPDILGPLVAELVARTGSLRFLQPLHGCAQLLRVAGAALCAGCGFAEDCPGAPVLAGQELAAVTGDFLLRQVDRLDLAELTPARPWPGLAAVLASRPRRPWPTASSTVDRQPAQGRGSPWRTPPSRQRRTS